MSRYRPITGTASILIAQLAIAREDAGLSYRDVARLSGRSHDLIRCWDQGIYLPGLAGFVDWASALRREVALLPIETTPTEETR